MSRRAQAVLLFGGWLLMLPPIKDGRIDEDAPIAKWRQWSAHDTAQACQSEQTQVFAQAKKKNSNMGPVMEEAIVAARCVPSEHIYPPKPPPPSN